MTPSTLIQTLFGSLLNNPAIVEVASQAGGSVFSVLRKDFTIRLSKKRQLSVSKPSPRKWEYTIKALEAINFKKAKGRTRPHEMIFLNI
jgi:hypothetical protein